MAYTKHTWANDEVITAEKLNNIEDGVENQQVGPAGKDGKDGAAGTAGKDGKDGKDGAAGVGVKAIALTTDSGGKVTGGKVTLTDNTTQDITVSTAPAS